MKLKFKNQAFQMDAVNAVVDLFAGQEKTRSTFSVMEEAQTNFLNELGQGNALYIDQETLTANMHTVQKRNNLPLTPTAEGCQFCIEMETGTGKTYVRTWISAAIPPAHLPVRTYASNHRKTLIYDFSPVPQSPEIHAPAVRLRWSHCCSIPDCSGSGRRSGLR